MQGNAVQEFVFQVMDSFGYIGIFALILIENLFPPIPSEVILTFGGFMTTYTSMTPENLVVTAPVELNSQSYGNGTKKVSFLIGEVREKAGENQSGEGLEE